MLMNAPADLRTEVLPANDTTLRQDTISPTDSKRSSPFPAAKSSGWMKREYLADRRDTLRSSISFPVQIQPLNAQLQPIGTAQPGLVLNYSSEGACLEYKQMLTETYIQIRWRDSQSRPHSAILRLRWCRSLNGTTLQSGGRVINMD